MKTNLLIITLLISTLGFSQNTNEVVDVVVNGKIETQESKNSQNYVATYLRDFFSKFYEKANGFYLVTEQKTTNNRNTLNIENTAFLSPKDLKKIILKSNGDKFPTVLFEFKKKGSNILKNITTRNIGGGIALIVDKKIIIMQMITEGNLTGKIEYNSMNNYEETEKIIKKLK